MIKQNKIKLILSFSYYIGNRIHRHKIKNGIINGICNNSQNDWKKIRKDIGVECERNTRYFDLALCCELITTYSK